MNSELDQLHDSLDLATVFLLSKGTCLDVEPKIGGFDPPKWMAKISWFQTPMNKWMIWVVKTPIFGSSHP